MESRSYMCTKYGKDVKSISDLRNHVSTCKISITLPNCKASKSAKLLEYTIINLLDLPSDSNKKGISPGTSNNGNKRIKPGSTNTMGNNNKDIRLQQSSRTLN